MHYFRPALILSLLVCALAAIAAETPPPLTVPGQRAPVYVRRSGDRAIQRGNGIVKWRAFESSAFDDAVKLNRPVFLFVTSNWSQRGRAMERTTFTDTAVAAWLNEEFIPVRLNRDERPEIDWRLQQAVQALAGTQGLPLTVALTPQGRVFFGGTWFPVDDDPVAQRPGMQTVLNRIRHVWRSQKDDALRQAQELDEALRKANSDSAAAPNEKSDYRQRVLSATRILLQTHSADAELSAGTLFPAPRAMELMLRTDEKNREADRQLAVKTMDALLRGGIHDQLEGGFFRCSVDSRWRVPRFEKTLAQNAEMIHVLLRLWDATADARYRDALLETVDFCNTLSDAQGCFYFGSLAGGSSDLDDGDYYTFTVGDVERLLPDDQDCRLARAFFDIQENGDLPLTAPNRNVLIQALSLPDAAKSAGMSADAAARRLPLIKQTLLNERRLRPLPEIDRNMYVDANALMAAALILAGQQLKLPAITARGIKIVDALIDLRRSEGTRGVHVIGARGPAPFLLQDEAATLYALAAAYTATRNDRYLHAARSVVAFLRENFADEAAGGFFDCARGHPQEAPGLNWRGKIYQDTQDPSAHGLIALACCKLVSAGHAEFRAVAETCTSRAVTLLRELGPYGATLTLALDELQRLAPRP
ncbi:MAG TPA: DUF255 domain-containing protein [Planctomycetota bacterium]|nr:DUF255 domain-containing protein [Planctomycetota bacterium]